MRVGLRSVTQTQWLLRRICWACSCAWRAVIVYKAYPSCVLQQLLILYSTSILPASAAQFLTECTLLMCLGFMVYSLPQLCSSDSGRCRDSFLEYPSLWLVPCHRHLAKPFVYEGESFFKQILSSIFELVQMSVTSLAHQS